jgi:hypothetical protein
MLFPTLPMPSMHAIQLCLIAHPIPVASGRITPKMFGSYGRRQKRVPSPFLLVVAPLTPLLLCIVWQTFSTNVRVLPS